MLDLCYLTMPMVKYPSKTCQGMQNLHIHLGTKHLYTFFSRNINPYNNYFHLFINILPFSLPHLCLFIQSPFIPSLSLYLSLGICISVSYSPSPLTLVLFLFLSFYLSALKLTNWHCLICWCWLQTMNSPRSPYLSKSASLWLDEVAVMSQHGWLIWWGVGPKI